MSIATIRAAIVTKLQSVTDIGVVQPYERYAKNLADVLVYYKSVAHQQIRGWNNSYKTASERGQIYTSSAEVSRWEIRGLMSVNDQLASRITFDNLIESVRDAFRADITLGGAIAECAEPQAGGEYGAQLEANEYAMFGSVLCHSCRLALPTYVHRLPV